MNLLKVDIIIVNFGRAKGAKYLKIITAKSDDFQRAFSILNCHHFGRHTRRGEPVILTYSLKCNALTGVLHQHLLYEIKPLNIDGLPFFIVRLDKVLILSKIFR